LVRERVPERPGSLRFWGGALSLHPRELGVLREGKFIAVGRKCLRVDFGPTRGGVFRIHPGHVVGR
jgi:hypothetical protein